jgi:hypothetical protein
MHQPNINGRTVTFRESNSSYSNERNKYRGSDSATKFQKKHKSIMEAIVNCEFVLKVTEHLGEPLQTFDSEIIYMKYLSEI